MDVENAPRGSFKVATVSGVCGVVALLAASLMEASVERGTKVIAAVAQQAEVEMALAGAGLVSALADAEPVEASASADRSHAEIRRSLYQQYRVDRQQRMEQRSAGPLDRDKIAWTPRQSVAQR